MTAPLRGSDPIVVDVALGDRSYDIVFIDPPFGGGKAQRCLQLLASSTLLAPGARVYLECGVAEAAPELPPGWLLHPEKCSGQVAYRLYLAPD